MNKLICPIIIGFAILFFTGCKKSNPIGKEEHSLFENIEHAAVHIQGGTGLAVNADTVMPGPNLNHDSIKHRRIDVTLPAMGNGYGGYIHFEADVTGDILVCVDVSVQMSVVNRSAQGDRPIEIERTFSEKEIIDSAKTTFVKSAILFEAKIGKNIIKFEPYTRQTIHAVIEEAEHDNH